MYYDDDYNDISVQFDLLNSESDPNSFFPDNAERNSCINLGNDIGEMNHNENILRSVNNENEIFDNNNNEKINLENVIFDNNNNEKINLENEIFDTNNNEKINLENVDNNNNEKMNIENVDNNNNENIDVSNEIIENNFIENNNNEINLNISENDFKEENLQKLYQNFYKKKSGFFNDDKNIKGIIENLDEVEKEYNLLFYKLFSDEKEKKNIENLDEFNCGKKNNENSLSHKQQNSTNSNSNSKNRNYSQSINKRESNSLNLSHNPNIFSNNSICLGVFNKDNNIIPRIIQGNENSNLSSDNDIMLNNNSLLFSNSLSQINKNSSLSISSSYINENQNKSQMINSILLHKKRKKDSKNQQIDEGKNRSQDCIPIKKKRKTHDKNEKGNMIKKIKTKFFTVLINKFNEKLKSANIESLNKNNALYSKKILPLTYEQKAHIRKDLNINLLGKAFKTILSGEVTGRQAEKKKFFNKYLIDYLLKIYNEESLENKQKLKKLIDFLNMKMENFFDIFKGKNIDTIFDSKDEFLDLVNKELEKKKDNKDNNYKKQFLENLMNFPSLIKNMKSKISTKVSNKRKSALFKTIQ